MTFIPRQQCLEPLLSMQGPWWRAHEQRIASAQSLTGRSLVLVSSQDKGLSLWTLGGGLVGRFGLHTWRLKDQATWQDLMVSY